MVYTVKRMDNTGHTTKKFDTPVETAAYVNEQKQSGYVAYLNGQLFGGERVTQSDLKGIDNIMLSTPLRGG